MTEDQKNWWANLLFIVLFTVCMAGAAIGHVLIEVRKTPEERRKAEIFNVW